LWDSVAIFDDDGGAAPEVSLAYRNVCSMVALPFVAFIYTQLTLFRTGGAWFFALISLLSVVIYGVALRLPKPARFFLLVPAASLVILAGAWVAFRRVSVRSR